MQEFVEEWVTGLDHDDKKALAMLLCFTLVTEDAFTETTAAQTAAKIIGKSDRTVLQWRSDLISNEGTFPQSLQGHYQRSGVLWCNEELSKKVSEFVRANTAVKGKPNLTGLQQGQELEKKL